MVPNRGLGDPGHERSSSNSPLVGVEDTEVAEFSSPVTVKRRPDLRFNSANAGEI